VWHSYDIIMSLRKYAVEHSFMLPWYVHGRCTRPLATVPSPLPLQESGTCYHWRSHHCRHCRLSSEHWRPNCFTDRTTTHTSGNSSIDTSLIHDTYCGPEVLLSHEIRGWWWWWWSKSVTMAQRMRVIVENKVARSLWLTVWLICDRSQGSNSASFLWLSGTECRRVKIIACFTLLEWKFMNASLLA